MACTVCGYDGPFETETVQRKYPQEERITYCPDCGDVQAVDPA